MRFRFPVALALVLIIGLTTCSVTGAREKYHWKVGTLAVEDIGWGKLIQQYGITAMNQATEGNLSIKVFWGGRMGDDEDIIEKMQQGILDGAGLTGAGGNMLVPEMTILNLPFLFEGYDEVDFIKEKMHPVFDRLMRDRGYFFLLWNDQDFDQVISTLRPMNSIQNFRQSRFLTWFGPVEETLLENLGVETVFMDVPEVPAEVKQGKVDAAIGPAVWVIAAQLHPVVKYVQPLNLRYSPSIVVVRNETWAQLPQKYKNNYMAQRWPMTKKITALVRQDNEKYYNALLQYGIRHVPMDPAQKEKIKKLSRRTYTDLAGRLYSQHLLNQVLHHLDDFRNARN